MQSEATSNGDTKRVLLLFTTTGYQAESFKAAAEALGIALVPGSDRCHVLDDPWRDGAIPLRFQEPETAAERIVESARGTPGSTIDAIIAIGDKPTLVAALASQALGIPGNSPNAVRACRDKYLFREALRAAGVPGPDYFRMRIDASPEAPAHIGFPCVLKPLFLSASRGVIRANNPAEFADAFRRIAALLEGADVRILREEAAEWILVEQYMPGAEVALEGILDRGELKALAIFDKPDPLDGPYFEETIYVTPSRLTQEVQQEIIASTEQAIRAVGLFHGPIHAEIRLTANGPRVLEIAARPIGGLCSRSLRFANGDAKPSAPEATISLEELIIRHALGEPLDHIERENRASGVMMIPVPAAGILSAAARTEEAARTPQIDDIRITAKVGQKLVPWPEGSSYLGFIFSRGDSAAEVESALRTAHRKIQFQITPALPVVR